MALIDFSKTEQPKQVDWSQYDGSGVYKLNNLNRKINEYSTAYTNATKGITELGKGWTDSGKTSTYLSSVVDVQNRADGIRNDLLQNAESYKKVLGDKKYNDLLNNITKDYSSAQETMKKARTVSELYSKYKDKDSYDADVRTYGYQNKYKGITTYQQANDFLNSQDYKSQRESGKISDEENEWLQSYGYSLATESDLQSEISSLEKETNSWNHTKSLYHQKKQEYNNLIANARSYMGRENEYKQKLAALQNEISDCEKEITVIDSKNAKLSALKTTLAKKQQKAEFEKRWSDDAANAQEAIKKAQDNDIISKFPAAQETQQSNNEAKKDAASKNAYIASNDFEEYRQYMFNDEIATYHWIEKNRGEKKAKAYMNDLISFELDGRKAQAARERAFNAASSSKGMAVLSSVGSVFDTLGSGVEYVYNLSSGKSDRRSVLAATASGAREGTKEHWAGTAGEEVWDFLYDTGMSGVDSLAAAGISVVVPYAGEALLGASAAANKANELLDSGVSGAQVVLGSVTSGVLEALFEHVSIGKFKSLATKDVAEILKEFGLSKKALAKIGENITKSVFTNTSEEFGTEVGNIVADSLIQGDLSQYAQQVEEYYASGKSIEEAKKLADSNMYKQVGLAAAGGGLMGFAFGTIGAAVGTVSTYRNAKSVGNVILKSPSGIENLKSSVAKFGTDSAVYKALSVLDSDSSAADVGLAYFNAMQKATEQSRSQLIEALKQNGAPEKGRYSASYFADRIMQLCLPVEKTKEQETQMLLLSTNQIAGPVVSAYAFDGKYGSDEIRTLQKAFISAEKESKAQNNSENFTMNQNPVDTQTQNEYNTNRGEEYVRTDEFRRLQEESKGMSAEDIQLYHSGSKRIDGGLRERLSRSVKSILLGTDDNGSSNADGVLRLSGKGNQFNIHQNVSGALFHDVFEIARNYLKYGELVDLHDVKTTENGIGYDDCYNYLSEDGLSGFSITPDGDLISVFNASGKSGFLRSIAPIVKEKAKTLDCYASPMQNLETIYETIFGFKTASVMEYNMEFDHDNIAKNHGSPYIAFMVNTEQNIQQRFFSKDEYDDAVAFRDRYVDKSDQNNSDDISDGNPNDTGTGSIFEEPSAQYEPESLAETLGRQIGKGQRPLTEDQKRIIEIGKKLGLEVDFDYRGRANGKITGNRVSINPNCSDPLRFVFKHEVVHWLENSKLYDSFQKYLLDESAAFQDWLKKKGYASLGEAIAATKERYGDIGYGKLKREVVADFVGDTLFGKRDGEITDDFLRELTKKDRNLAERFIDWIKSLVQRMKGTEVEKDIIKLEQKMIRMKETVDKNAANSGEVKYSFAGERAVTANKSLLETAKQRIENGEDSETVRRETGWFKGYDGKWRFEINDKMSELVENPKLETHGNDEDGLYQTVRLADVLKHDDLFKAYPELKDYKVIIQETNAGVEGSFFPKRKEIVLSRNLFERITKEYYDYLNGGRKAEIAKIEQTHEYKEYSKFYDNPELANIDPEEWLKLEKEARDKFFSSELGKRYYQLNWGKVDIRKYEPGWSKGAKSVLFHEIQHAIQNIEGFASGSNITNWQSKINSAESEYRRAEKEYEKRYDGLVDVLARYGFSDEKFENIDLTTESGVKEAKKYLEEVGAPNGALELADALIEYANDRNNSFGKYLKLKNRSASDLYESTAGEIESRDVEKRLNYSAEQRKNTRPDIDRTDVVFADGSTGISLSKDISEYPYNMQTVIKEYMSSADESIERFIKTFNSNNRFARHKISNVTENQATDIKRLLGIDVNGFTNDINTNAIRHIEKRHGKNGIADSSMSNISDIARIGYVLKNYDDVEIAKNGLDEVNSAEFRNSKNEPAPMLIFSKKINGTYYVAQAIPDSEYKKLWIVSAYISEKEAGTQALNTKNKSQVGMSLASSASDTTVPQKAQSVNTQYTQNSENDSQDGQHFESEEENAQYSIPSGAQDMSFDDLSKLVDSGEMTSEEAFQVLRERYGTMDSGEKPKVDVKFPKKISDVKTVSRYARTAAESGHLDDGMSDRQRKEILNGGMTYQVISDKSAMEKADNAVKEDFAAAVQKWQDIINSGKLMNKNDIALGERLLQQAAENGNASDTMKYIAELAELGTRMGQNIQALSLLKKMTGIGKLYYVQRAVDSLNRDIEQKYNGKKKPAEIDQDLAQLLADSKSNEDAEAIAADIIKDVADQIPSTFLDKWNAWRYLSMLGNPRTHIRNMVGNAVFVPAIRIKDTVSFVGERFISKEKRTKTIGIIKPEYRKFAVNDFGEMQGILTGGGKMNPSDQIRDQQKVFKNKLLETLRQKNFSALEVEDMLFLKMHYVRALGGLLQARGIDINHISAEQLNEARLYAVKEAQKATYRDASAVAEALNRFQYSKSKSVRAFGMLVEGVLPFKKTPINILKRGVEYSPIGLMESLTKGAIDLKKGKITSAEFIDGISAGLTGTGILILGAFLQSLGIIVGGLEYDDDDVLKRMAGAQEYSIQIGDVSYTVDWMVPAVLPMLVGAEIGEFFAEDEQRSAISFIVDALAAIGEPMTELSMLSGLNDAIESVAYSDNKLTDLVLSSTMSYFSQAIPTLGGQIARTADGTRRSNYVDKNSDVPSSIQLFHQKALGKIPIAENTKIPYVDAWGRTKSTGNPIGRAAQNFISPGYFSKVEKDSVNDEIARLYVELGEKGVLPKTADKSFQVNGGTKYLTADEYVAYATAKGKTSRKYAEDLFAHPMYQRMDDMSKAKVLELLYEYANAKAKSEVSDYDYTSTYATAAKLEKAGVDPVDYYIAKVATSTDNADKDGSGTVKKKEYEEALMKTSLSRKTKEKIFFSRYKTW